MRIRIICKMWRVKKYLAILSRFGQVVEFGFGFIVEINIISLYIKIQIELIIIHVVE